MPSSGNPSSSSSFNCQRCSQPLQLHESLSDEALLASAASSSSNEGALTTSNYDVISSLVTKNSADAPSTAGNNDGMALRNVRDTELREAVLRHHRSPEYPHNKQRHGNGLAAPNSLTARLSLHTRLFELVSSFVPAAEIPAHPISSPSSSSSSSAQQSTVAERLSAVRATHNPSRGFPLGIDHPLCLDCSDYCLEVIRRQVEETRKERDAYAAFNQVLDDDNDMGQAGQVEVARLEAEIVELQAAVDVAVQALYKSDRVKKDLEEELKQLEAEERELEAEEADFWAAHSKLLSETTALESTRSSLQRSLQVSELTLARLNSTNVFYDAFCIGHEAGGLSSSGTSNGRKRSGGTGLATINGLRFGKSSSSSSGSSSSSSSGSTTVEWNEVNAAWGQVALLVEVLRGRIGARLDGESLRGGLASTTRRTRDFVGWRVRPKGSTSAMEKLPPSASQQNSTASATAAAASSSSSTAEDVYELYHPGPWAGVTRMLHARRFDAAMIGILDCTSQLFQWAEQICLRSSPSPRKNTDNDNGGADLVETPPRMIHAINGEKIGDISIRLAGAFFASEDTWSRATKYLLVNLQVLMHWATRNETVPVPAPT